MDGIPIFSGGQTELDAWLTCGQFLSVIEDFSNKDELDEAQVKELCLSKLSDKALELFQKNFDQSWQQLKILLLKEFSVKLTIREKVEVRKKLQQLDTESIEDFYQRCIQSQYLVSDDIRDAAFEREVLLHFLIGLTPFIRDLVLSSKCSTSEDYINEAKRYVQNIKDEPIEPKIKMEFDPSDEQFDEKYTTEEFYDYANENVYVEHLEIEPEIKAESISSTWNCENCNETFITKNQFKVHCEDYHKKCAKCGKTFVDKDKHYKVWHSKVDCKHCEFRDILTLPQNFSNFFNSNSRSLNVPVFP